METSGETASAVEALLNNNHATDIEVSTTVEVCTSFFHIGDKFSSFKEIQEVVKSVEIKTGTKYWMVDAKKIESRKSYNNINKESRNFYINKDLVYHHLKYNCVQGGRKHRVRTRKNCPRVRFNTSTLRNGCEAHVRFGISKDKHYLEVRSCSDVHNHEISKIKARTKVSQLLANEGLDASLGQNRNINILYSTADSQRTSGFFTLPVKCVDGHMPEGSDAIINDESNFSGAPDISESNAEELTAQNLETEDKMLLIRRRADQAVEDLVREKKRSNDLKEKLLEESQKRNQYLEALLRIKCLKYNHTLEELTKQ